MCFQTFIMINIFPEDHENIILISQCTMLRSNAQKYNYDFITGMDEKRFICNKYREINWTQSVSTLCVSGMKIN